MKNKKLNKDEYTILIKAQKILNRLLGYDSLSIEMLLHDVKQNRIKVK